jgi:uncharacterized protein
MTWSVIIENLTNPALLFFILGLVAVQLKSDLGIPSNSSKFISIYLLFSIGFKGGHELAHSDMDLQVLLAMLFGILLAGLIPVYLFFILRTKFSIANAGAIAASYGSISAVTFVSSVAYLENHGIDYSGHMVAVMALMEAPAIAIGVLLISLSEKGAKTFSIKQTIMHSFTNGSVLLIIGSLIIGFVANDAQADGIAPFTTDIFKGFLAVFLLDMGISSGRKIKTLFEYGWFPFAFAIIVPLINGIATAYLSQLITSSPGDRFLFAVLAASASYIAVPAAMRLVVPKANAGLYIPMALAITFPVNIAIGLPIYYAISS